MMGGIWTSPVCTIHTSMDAQKPDRNSLLSHSDHSRHSKGSELLPQDILLVYYQVPKACLEE